jgi:hypothetical protein
MICCIRECISPAGPPTPCGDPAAFHGNLSGVLVSFKRTKRGLVVQRLTAPGHNQETGFDFLRGHSLLAEHQVHHPASPNARPVATIVREDGTSSGRRRVGSRRTVIGCRSWSEESGASAPIGKSVNAGPRQDLPGPDLSHRANVSSGDHRHRSRHGHHRRRSRPHLRRHLRRHRTRRPHLRGLRGAWPR